jgi:soluble lytic murein transglycosylase-like protein
MKEGEDGKLEDSVVDQINGEFIPGSTTETWGSKFPGLTTGLRDAIRRGKEEDLNAQERQEAREDKERERGILQLYEQSGGFTEAQKAQIESEYRKAGKQVPESIKNLLSIEKKEDGQARTYLNQLRSTRGLTMEDLLNKGYSADVINEFKPYVREFEAGVKNNPQFKVGLEAIKTRITNDQLGDSPPGTRPNWTVPLKIAEAQSLYQKKVLAFMQSSSSPEEAATRALADVMKLIDQGRPSAKGPGAGPFAVVTAPGNPSVPKVNGGYVSIFKNSTLQAVQAREAKFKARYNQIQALKAKGVDFTQEVSLDKEELDQLEKIRTNPNAEFPAFVQYLSRESQTRSVWDIADIQLAKAGRQPLTKPPEIQWQQKLDPQLQRLLTFSPSTNRTQRAFTGTPWNASKVPNGYGAIIDKAAAKYGLDPALLAGLLYQENRRWDPRAVSGAGAVGLGQIMPNTIGDAGMTSLNDRLDPVKSIYGAARILSTRLKYFKGDVTMALRSYNMGIRGAETNPGGYPGDRESIEYPSGVLKFAATFGYGYSEGSPYRRQEAMHPSIGGLSPVQTTLANTPRLRSMEEGLCTTAVLETLADNKIPNPKATGNDPGNNPRGLASQLVNSFGWKPLPGLGRPETINSPYGRFTVNMMTNQEYQQAIKAGRIPSGALSFATRHSTWNGSVPKSSGYDVSIVRNRGMNHFNGPMLGSEIYPGKQTLVFVLIHPKDGRRS